MTVIQHMVQDLMQEESKTKTVSPEQYRQWAAGFVFEGLRNQRYGQSFCNYFGIQDKILFFTSTVADADRYIQEHYVR